MSNSLDYRDTLLLRQRLANCLPLASEFEGIAFRSVTPQYANEVDLIAGWGASYYGARWNPRTVRAVYLSLDPAVAIKESMQEFYKYGFSQADIKPRVVVGIQAKLQSVLNLTDPKIRRKLHVSLHAILTEDWQSVQEGGREAMTQAIGRSAREVGVEGIVVNSAIDRTGKNLVVFPDALRSGSSLAVVNSQNLPRQ